MSAISKKLIVLYCLALVAGLFWVILVARHSGWNLTPYLSGNDTTEYLAIAKNLVMNGEYSKSVIAPFIPNFFRLPGYPFWLALVYFIFKSFTPAIFLGIAIFALSAPLIYLIMKNVFSEKLAFWSGIIFALEPRMAFSAPFLLSEQIFVPLFLLAVFFSVKFLDNIQNKKYIFLSAALFGLLALFKAIALYLWLPMLILFYFGMRKYYSGKVIIKILFLSTFILIIIITPWILRNKFVLNTWQFSSSGGLVIYWGHLEILERYLGTPSNLAYQKLIDRANHIAGSNWETVEAAKILSREAASEIKKNFPLYLKIYFFNLPLFFITDGYKGIVSYISDINQNYTNFSDLILRLKFSEFISRIKEFSLLSLILPAAGRGVWLILTILSFFGMLLSVKIMLKKRLMLSLFIFLILYFAALTGPIGFDPRYRMPVNGFLITLALVAVFYIFKLDFKHEQTG